MAFPSPEKKSCAEKSCSPNSRRFPCWLFEYIISVEISFSIHFSCIYQYAVSEFRIELFQTQVPTSLKIIIHRLYCYFFFRWKFVEFDIHFSWSDSTRIPQNSQSRDIFYSIIIYHRRFSFLFFFFFSNTPNPHHFCHLYPTLSPFILSIFCSVIWNDFHGYNSTSIQMNNNNFRLWRLCVQMCQHSSSVLM